MLQLDESGEILRMTRQEADAKLRELQEETEKLKRVEIIEPQKKAGRPKMQVQEYDVQDALDKIQEDIDRLLMKPDYVSNQEVQLKDIQEKVQYLYNSVYEPPVQPRKKWLGIF